MAFRELECTQGVWGYQTANRTFVQKGGKRLLAWALRPPPARCRQCGSRDVRAYSHQGLLATAYGFHDYPFLRFDLGERNPVNC